jgi:site-specific DNA-methyltransferase (adenine-specific)
MLNITNENCLDLMARYPDKHFQLAICDPPYNLGKKLQGKHPSSHLANRAMCKMNTDWDLTPFSIEQWKEIQRVSVHQVMWGANYYSEFLPNSRCWIVWDKCQPWENFSQVELAWTSFDAVAPLFKFDNRTGDKIHPTQKPTDLYKWLLHKYAKQGDKILDCFLGSGSIAIACHDYGFDLTACELDTDYYNAAMKRIKNHTAQLKLF